MEDTALRKYAAEKRFDEALLSRLAALSAEEGRMLERLVNELSPSANTLREFIRLADEISARDHLALAEILTRDEVEAIYQLESVNRKEKQKQIRLYLESCRYPTIAAIRQELDDCQRSLQKSFGLKVAYPKDLEGDTLTINFSARNSEGLVEIAKKLALLGKDPLTRKMFSILKGEVQGDSDA